MVASKPKGTLQAKSADSVFLIGNMPHGSEPQLQRFARILKNRSGGYRRFIFARRTIIQTLLGHPMLSALALGALETFRPSKLGQIVAAFYLRVKPLLKFHKISGVRLHAHACYI
jgi:hypothetical protein